MTFTDDEVATIRGALLRALEDQGGEYPDYDGGHGLEPEAAVNERGLIAALKLIDSKAAPPA
jgi:hypothetical protein